MVPKQASAEGQAPKAQAPAARPPLVDRMTPVEGAVTELRAQNAEQQQAIELLTGINTTLADRVEALEILVNEQLGSLVEEMVDGKIQALREELSEQPVEETEQAAEETEEPSEEAPAEEAEQPAEEPVADPLASIKALAKRAAAHPLTGLILGKDAHARVKAAAGVPSAAAKQVEKPVAQPKAAQPVAKGRGPKPVSGAAPASKAAARPGTIK